MVLKGRALAGTVTRAAPLAGARTPAFVLEIDFGPDGTKRSCCADHRAVLAGPADRTPGGRPRRPAAEADRRCRFRVPGARARDRERSGPPPARAPRRAGCRGLLARASPSPERRDQLLANRVRQILFGDEGIHERALVGGSCSGVGRASSQSSSRVRTAPIFVADPNTSNDRDRVRPTATTSPSGADHALRLRLLLLLRLRLVVRARAARRL